MIGSHNYNYIINIIMTSIRRYDYCRSAHVESLKHVFAFYLHLTEERVEELRAAGEEA